MGWQFRSSSSSSLFLPSKFAFKVKNVTIKGLIWTRSAPHIVCPPSRQRYSLLFARINRLLASLFAEIHRQFTRKRTPRHDPAQTRNPTIIT